MKKQVIKILKSLILGLLVFVVLNKIDADFFYDYHNVANSPLIRFYFAPILLFADFINLIIPISETEFFRRGILNPIHVRPDLYYTNIVTFAIGLLWSSLLVYIYYISGFFKKLPKILRLIVYFIFVIVFIWLSSKISTIVFGDWYNRYCPMCP